MQLQVQETKYIPITAGFLLTGAEGAKIFSDSIPKMLGCDMVFYVFFLRTNEIHLGHV